MESLKTDVCGNHENEWNRSILKESLGQDLPVKQWTLKLYFYRRREIGLILPFCFNNTFIFLFVAGYACRLLTPEMKLLICSEESLDVSNSRCQEKKRNKFEYGY